MNTPLSNILHTTNTLFACWIIKNKNRNSTCNASWSILLYYTSKEFSLYMKISISQRCKKCIPFELNGLIFPCLYHAVSNNRSAGWQLITVDLLNIFYETVVVFSMFTLNVLLLLRLAVSKSKKITGKHKVEKLLIIILYFVR